jgi:hypothetical protein
MANSCTIESISQSCIYNCTSGRRFFINNQSCSDAVSSLVRSCINVLTAVT